MLNSTDNAPHHWLDDLLAAQADALIAGEEDFRVDKYNLTSSQVAEANDLLNLATSVRESLQPVTPSEAFVLRLKDELTGEPQGAFLVRWRKLPPQYQLAAKLGGLTITAGIMLLAARTGINAVEALQHRNQPKTDSKLSLNTASS